MGSVVYTDVSGNFNNHGKNKITKPKKMNKEKYIILLLIILISYSSYGQSKYKQIDSLYKSGEDSTKFNGNILIAENGKVTFKKSYGYSNLKTKEKLNENSLFNIGSLTKQFTAISIVILEQKDSLQYDDKVTKYLPELKQFSNITIRNLLNHTSGIPNMNTTGNSEDQGTIDSLLVQFKNPKNQDLINILSSNKVLPHFEPSTQYEYSNTNYALLASIVEKISQKSYANFLKENIFIPLKMDRTMIYNKDFYKNKNIAVGYINDSLGNEVVAEKLSGFEPFARTMTIFGAGNIYSTTSDLFIWITNFKKLITTKSFEEIIARPLLKDETKTDYGFGFELGFWKDYSPIISHGGRWPGFLSNIDYNLKNEKVFIELENKEDENFITRNNSTKNIIYEIKPSKFITLDVSEIKPLAGKYFTEKGSEKEIIFEDGKLLILMNPEVKLELQPISNTRFIVDGFMPEVEYEFVIKNEKVEKIIIKQPEQGIKNILINRK